MKKIYYLLAALVGIFAISSCSNEIDLQNEEVTTFKTQAEANAFLVNYLELIDDEYVLNISVSQAKDLGVPIIFFNEAKEEINRTNKIINEAKTNSDIELQLTDPKEKIRLDGTRTDGFDPKGTLAPSRQNEEISGFVWAPREIKSILFTCRANAAITPVFTCKTYSSALWKTKTAVGVLGSLTKVRVGLYVSNDYIRVAFSTSDSNGGSAYYEGSDQQIN